MKPRILHIISGPDCRAEQKQLRLLVGGLPKDQFDFHICVLDGQCAALAPCPSPGTGEGRDTSTSTHSFSLEVPVTVISKRWRYDPRAFWQLRDLIRRLRPDLIHAWTYSAVAHGLAAAKTAGVDRFVAACDFNNPGGNGPQAAIDRYFYRHCTQLIANNSKVRDFFSSNGLPAEKVRMIHPAVEPMPPNTTTRRQLLAEFGMGENSRLIGLATRLLPQNRVKDAIWAADLLKVVHANAHLLIFGDGPHRGQLRRFRDQVRIADFVHFLGQRTDLDRIMPHFDLLWSTNPNENPSGAILEAMCAGVPVVACDTPAVRDFVIDGQTGFLAPTGDRAAFARHAYQLFQDPDLSRRLGQAGQQRALAEFSPDKMIFAHAEIYRRILV